MSEKKKIRDAINESKAKERLEKEIKRISQTYLQQLPNLPESKARLFALMEIQTRSRTPRNLELQANPHQQRRELQRQYEREHTPKKKKRPKTMTPEEFERQLQIELAKG